MNPTTETTASQNFGFRFSPADSPTFARASFVHDWLIPQVLVAGQPAVVGGPKKSGKTSLCCDLAISLGSGTPFLGHFKIAAPSRVLVLSGESGAATLQSTARRICDSRRLNLESCDVLWQPDSLPCLSKADDLGELKSGLLNAGVKVVIIDPLYLCLIAGGGNINAGNLYEVGPVLAKATRACLDAGATPIFVHHATKAASRPGGVIDLDDLAWAGLGEFARQWILLGRREAFEPGDGVHKLTMSIGGSAGHSGLWNVDINEGDENRRFWIPVVTSLTPISKRPLGRSR